jgi:xylulose-5-phosphate/fructose-6-phosphate phosphoketolase
LLIIGYRTELQGLLFHRPNLDRVTIEGYDEEGTTTTPFSMMLVNRCSRFHVAMAAVRGGKRNPKVQIKRQELLTNLDRAIKKAKVYFNIYLSNVQEYALKYEKDPDDCYALPEFDDWKPKASKPVVSSSHKTEDFFVN